jgi:amidase
LKGAKFGLPWSRVWESASNKDKYKSQYEMLQTVINSMRNAGAEVIDRTDFPSGEEIIPPDGWDWYAE